MSLNFSLCPILRDIKCWHLNYEFMLIQVSLLLRINMSQKFYEAVINSKKIKIEFISLYGI